MPEGMVVANEASTDLGRKVLDSLGLPFSEMVHKRFVDALPIQPLRVSCIVLSWLCRWQSLQRPQQIPVRHPPDIPAQFYDLVSWIDYQPDFGRIRMFRHERLHTSAVRCGHPFR